MSKTRDIHDCKGGKELVDYSVKQGAGTRNGHGSHTIVYTPKGSVPIPVHGHRDLGKGIKHVIIKQLIAIGITGILLVCAIPFLIGG